MANAHMFSAGVDLPNQTLAPMVSPTEHGDHEKDKDGFVNTTAVEGDVPRDMTVHEQDMPEGPTTTRWEEWAYVRSCYAPSPTEAKLEVVLIRKLSTCTITVIPVLDRTDTPRLCSR